MLPWGFSTPATNVNTSVEPQIEVPVVAELSLISQPILTELLEVHATELYSLTIEESWQAYHGGTLVITELSPNKLYRLNYDGILEIVFTEGGS